MLMMAQMVLRPLTSATVLDHVLLPEELLGMLTGPLHFVALTSSCLAAAVAFKLSSNPAGFQDNAPVATAAGPVHAANLQPTAPLQRASTVATSSPASSAPSVNSTGRARPASASTTPSPSTLGSPSAQAGFSTTSAGMARPELSRATPVGSVPISAHTRPQTAGASPTSQGVAANSVATAAKPGTLLEEMRKVYENRPVSNGAITILLQISSKLTMSMQLERSIDQKLAVMLQQAVWRPADVFAVPVLFLGVTSVQHPIKVGARMDVRLGVLACSCCAVHSFCLMMVFMLFWLTRISPSLESSCAECVTVVNHLRCLLICLRNVIQPQQLQQQQQTQSQQPSQLQPQLQQQQQQQQQQQPRPGVLARASSSHAQMAATSLPQGAAIVPPQVQSVSQQNMALTSAQLAMARAHQSGTQDPRVMRPVAAVALHSQQAQPRGGAPMSAAGVAAARAQSSMPYAAFQRAQSAPSAPQQYPHPQQHQQPPPPPY
jgi:hypothetical protein